MGAPGKDTPRTTGHLSLPLFRERAIKLPMQAPLLCIGSALWDVIGQADHVMTPGHDSPGRISRHPGGVALNIANALVSEGLTPTFLTAVGRDGAGDELLAIMREDGIEVAHVARVDGRTDIYMAIEQGGALFGAVADCASLERAGATILQPLIDGRIAAPEVPFRGHAVIDGNLPVSVLQACVTRGLLSRARVIFVPASPGKAERMVPLLGQTEATLFVNRVEAEVICGCQFADSLAAARALAARGTDAVVTDSAAPATLARGKTLIQAIPPAVTVRKVTGAGDAFLAGFVAAEIAGADDDACLQRGIDAAARHVSGAAP